MFKTNFSGRNKFGGYASPWLLVWGKSWWSKFYQRNCQKRWTMYPHCQLCWSKSFELTNFFVAMRRMGSEHQSLLFWYVCSLALTGKSSRKTLRAPAWN